MSAVVPAAEDMVSKVLSLLTSPAGQQILIKLLTDHGITEDKVAKAISELRTPTPPPEDK